MFTAMYEFKDSFGKQHANNCRIGGYLNLAPAIRAILKKSPSKSGRVQIGQRAIIIIHRGKIIHL